MGLHARLTGDGLLDDGSVEKLPIMQFCAGLRELARGNVTKVQLVNYFNLDATEESDLDWIIAQAASMTLDEKLAFASEIQDVLVMTEEAITSQSPIYGSEADVIARLGQT